MSSVSGWRLSRPYPGAPLQATREDVTVGFDADGDLLASWAEVRPNASKRRNALRVPAEVLARLYERQAKGGES